MESRLNSETLFARTLRAYRSTHALVYMEQLTRDASVKKKQVKEKRQEKKRDELSMYLHPQHETKSIIGQSARA